MRNRSETGLAIQDSGDALVVPINDPDAFKSADGELVVLDADKGILARMGTTESGDVDIMELHFLTAEPHNWDLQRVRSFLDAAGFDARRGERRLRVERGRIEAATVEEDEDWWVIKDNVLTRSGAFNGMLRPAAAFERVWRLYEGVPITHPHPPDIVQGMELVAGMVENVHLEPVKAGKRGRRRREADAEVQVVADYRLAKHTGVDGLHVNDEMVRLNAETIERVRAGKGVDNSQGYLFSAREEKGKDSEGREFTHVAEEWIPNHLAILLEQEGACNWGDGCGVGRLAGEVLQEAARKALGRHRSAQMNRHESGGKRRPPGAPHEEDAHMGHETPCGTCEEALKAKLAEAKQESAAAEKKVRAHLAETAKLLGVEAAADEEPTETLGRRVAEAAKTEAAALVRYREEERKVRDSLVESVAGIAHKAGVKGEDGKPASLEALKERYGGWNMEALVEHRALMQAALEKRGGGADNTRLAASGSDSGAQPSGIIAGLVTERRGGGA